MPTAEEETRKLGVVVSERLVESQAVVAVGELEYEQDDVLLLVVKLQWGVLFVHELKKIINNFHSHLHQVDQEALDLGSSRGHKQRSFLFFLN